MYNFAQSRHLPVLTVIQSQGNAKRQAYLPKARVKVESMLQYFETEEPRAIPGEVRRVERCLMEEAKLAVPRRGCAALCWIDRRVSTRLCLSAFCAVNTTRPRLLARRTVF